jgi:BirA family biotin operon repressor/biotin-[acetyl-CoA-carboxylase] ligase
LVETPDMPPLDGDAIDPDTVRAALAGQVPPMLLDVRASCQSSNAVLMDAAERGAPHGSVVVCEEQTEGRGRRGRAWLSVPGGSLTFSLLWRFPPAAPLMGLSLAVGVAVVQALESLGATGVALKWPNDLLHGGAKLGGILVELVPPGGALPAAVIGVGLNVRLPGDFHIAADYAVADLAQALPRLPSRNALLACALISLHAVLARFGAGGFAVVRDEWRARHAFQGVPVRLIAERETTVGICCGVDDDGALLLQTDAGVRRILSGDVSLR